VRYTVTNLGPETPQANQAKLIAALESIPGVKDVTLTLPKREITFGIKGPEPKVKLLKEACAGAGFTLGQRM
jgi:hypothetical protein